MVNIEAWVNGSKEDSDGYRRDHLYPVTNVEFNKKLSEDRRMFEINIKITGIAFDINKSKNHKEDALFRSCYGTNRIEYNDQSVEMYAASSYDIKRALRQADKTAAAVLNNIYTEALQDSDAWNKKHLFLIA